MIRGWGLGVRKKAKGERNLKWMKILKKKRMTSWQELR